MGPSVFISRNETQKSLPGIETKGLLGGVLYHDGQFDDSRLAINLAQTIIENGGCAINYVRVTSLLKTALKNLRELLLTTRAIHHLELV